MTQPRSRPRRQHWAQINEFSFAAGISLMFAIFRILGRWPFRVARSPVLLWYLITRPETRASSGDYLRRIAVFQGASRVRPGRGAVLRHFALFAESLLDRMLLWDGLFKTECIEFHGQEQIAAQMTEKRGALLICSHFGNLDLCRVLSKRAGFKLTVLVHTKHAELGRLAGYARRLEFFCLRAPLQWFNFYDFWHLSTVDTPDAPC